MKSLLKNLHFFSLLGILLLGISIILCFSYLIYASFSKGIDASFWVTMSELAQVEGVSDGHPISITGFTIASRWQDIPADIQAQFSRDTLQVNELQVMTNNEHVFALPSQVFVASLFENETGQVRFVTNITSLDASGISYALQLFIVMTFAIITFSSIVIATIFYQRSSIKELRDWAQALNADNLKQSPPPFNYHELDTLASIIYRSLYSVQKTVAREHHFLRDVSHELRTPIAVINSNLSLLEKMKQAGKTVEQQSVVFERIARANSTMLHITETLLWLNREEDRGVSYVTIRLDELVGSIDASLRYLLQGKQVSVEIELQAYELQLPLGGCHIVIANLLRNAFQHTDNGVVQIKQGTNFVSVRNINFEHSQRPQFSPISFGLGLKLVKKLAKRFEWKYRYVIEQDGYYVEVYF